MKIIFITGNHPRHHYLVKKFSSFFKNFIWLQEKREINIDHKKLLKDKLYKKHILEFKDEEKLLFKSDNFLKKNKDKILYFTRKKNSNVQFNNKIHKMIKNFQPDYLLAYGCQKISEKNLTIISSFNVHGGLLPYYRGVNTNFWPHYNKESNLVGMTLHKMSKKIDCGEVFYQVSPKIRKTDTINMLSCRAIELFCNVVPKKLFFLLKQNPKIRGIKTKKIKKLWCKKDFKIIKINTAYDNFEKFKNKKIKLKKKIKLLNLN